MRRAWITAALVVAGATQVASAREGAKPWAAATAPAAGDAAAIGGYSAGCLRGGVALASNGTGFQVMRPSRRRYFGHPALVEFIGDLGARVHEAKLGVVLIGDLGQARGGPAPSGHASHQSGLDADIWYWFPRKARKHRLSKRDRERISARTVANRRTQSMTAHWTPRMAKVLRIAAEDDRVARIFVNPLVKRAVCESAGKDRTWLRKLRPWWGHDSHFHVRLACPPDSAACIDQPALPEGDGCDDIAWWLDEKAQAARAARRKDYRGKISDMPELPAACADVLAADKPPR